MGAPALAELSEGDLARRAQAGDEAAFTELFARLRRPVVSTLRRYTRRPEDLDDALSEVFRRAYSRLPSLREPDRVGPWVLTIARHHGIDLLRSRRQHEELEPERVASDDDGPADVYGLEELARVLRDAMVRLPARDATVLTMTTYLGAGPTEVASALGISYGAAKVTIHRARRRLREQLVAHVIAQVRDLGCDELRELLDAGELGAAVERIGGCDTCSRAVFRELSPDGVGS